MGINIVTVASYFLLCNFPTLLISHKFTVAIINLAIIVATRRLSLIAMFNSLYKLHTIYRTQRVRLKTVRF